MGRFSDYYLKDNNDDNKPVTTEVSSGGRFAKYYGISQDNFVPEKPKEIEYQSPYQAETPTPGLFDKVKKKVSDITEGVKTFFTTDYEAKSKESFDQAVDMYQKDKGIQLTDIEKQEYEDKFLKFPSILPMKPEFQPTKEQIQAHAEFWSDPIENSVKATQDFLYYHPKINDVLAEAQRAYEKVLNIDAFATLKGVNRGLAQQYFGTSQEALADLERRLPEPVDSDFGFLYNVGEVVGTVMAFALGGEILKGLQFGKATLPVLFGTLGQTSESDLNIEQRVQKLPVDVVSGWIFSFIKPLQGLKGKELGIEALKGLGISGGATGGQGFLDALIKGLSPEDALKVGRDAALIGTLFYIAGEATGYFQAEILNSKTIRGDGIFTSDEVSKFAQKVRTKYGNTEAGKILANNLDDLANEALTNNKNVKIDMEALYKSALSKKLGLNRPEELKYKAELVEKPGEVGTKTEPVEPTTPKNLPDVVKQEVNKPKTTVTPNAKLVEEAQKSIEGIGGKVSKVTDNGDGSTTVFSDKLKLSFTETEDQVLVHGFYRGEQGAKGEPTKVLDTIKDYAKGNNKTITATNITGNDIEYWKKVGFTPIDISDGKGTSWEAVFDPTVPAVENVKTEVVKPKVDEFYILNNKQQFEKVSGEEVKILNGYDTFISKIDNEYVVSEGKTGLRISGSGSKKKAIEDARALMNENRANLDQLLQDKVSEYGESPRYLSRGEGESKIQVDEKRQKPTTDKGAKSGDRSGKLPDTAQVGAGESTDIGGKDKDSGREVPSGKRSVSTTSIRERLATRISTPEEAKKVYEEDSPGNMSYFKSGGIPLESDIIGVDIPESVAKKTDEKIEEDLKSAMLVKKLTPEKVKTQIKTWKKELQKDIDRYDELLEKGEDALSEYDKKVSNDIESTISTALALKHNHIYYNKEKIAEAQRYLGIKPKTEAPKIEVKEPKTKNEQVKVNQQIEELVKAKGTDSKAYTEEEKALLKLYSGSGGLEKAGADGRGLLDEYFTPKEIVDLLYSKLSGFATVRTDSRIIEPSVGTGRFIEPLQDTPVIGYEINKTSADITSILYPNTVVMNQPFENLFIDDRGNRKTYRSNADFVVGNPPYGEHRGKYLGLGEEPKISKYEEYFVKRGMDILKPEGYLAMVLPSSFLRSPVSYAKQQIAEMGRVVDAYRLPNGAFDTTTIGTDVVIIKKDPLPDERTGAEESIKEARLQQLSGDKFFVDNPNKVLGEVSKGTGNYGTDEVKGSLDEALSKAGTKKATKVVAPETNNHFENFKIENFDSYTPSDINGLWDDASSRVEDMTADAKSLVKDLKEQYKNLKGKDANTQIKKREINEKIEKHEGLIQALENQLNEQNEQMQLKIAKEAIKYAQSKGLDLGEVGDNVLDDLSEEWANFRDDFLTRIYDRPYIESNWKDSLTKITDELVTEYKKVEAPVQVELKESKTEKPLEQGNRVAQPKAITDEANKKAIIEPKKKDKTIKLTEGVSKSEVEMWQNVTVTGELSETYTSKFGDPKEFKNNDIAIVLEDGRAKYYPAFNYYQGKIYEKLDQLETFKEKLNPEQYKAQRQGLEKVLPTPKKLSEINLQPIADFVRDIKFDVEGKETGILTLFRDYLHSLPHQAFGGSSSWEIDGYMQGSIVNSGDKIRNAEIRKRRREVGNRLFKRFIDESLNDTERKIIESKYNRTYNGYHRPDYTKVPLLGELNATFKGKALEVKEIQREGAAFLTTRGVGLLGYDVGVGKTMTAIVGINEVMKRGWAKRPLIVVPNGVYLNWIKEISDIMPGVKINSLANLGGKFKGDLKTLNIAENTLSIMTYDGLLKLGFKDETYNELTKDLQDVMSGMSETKRGKAKEQEKIESNIGRAMRGTSVDTFFEDLGFDHLTIDEVHNFKNIFAGAKLQSGKGNEFRNVRGSSSIRGIKGYLMSQYVLKNNNDRNVFLLSATPFTNNPLEIYSIISLMGKRRLEGLGLKNVNDFMTMFMELKPTFVVKADQTVKEEDVIEKFQNLQQLQQLVTEFIDFRTGEEAGVARPEKVKKTLSIQANQKQVDYILKAQDLFKDKNNGGAIVAITELQNITLSPYLSRYNEDTPTYKEFVENSPKVKYAIEAVRQVKKDNPEVGQVIYMPRGVEYFNHVKDYLVKELRYKPDQIGAITGGMSVDAKQTIQSKFNSGEIKVLLGTESIKEGINLQERATELYHLHLPWNPTDMLQVEGRIWRQGNMWQNVRVHYPLVENSVDSFIFQKLETKEKRIKNLWSYKGDDINVGDLNFEEMKLDLITDPVIRAEAERTFETAKEKKKLDLLKVEKAFLDRKLEKLQTAQKDIDNATKWIENNKDDERLQEYYKNKLSQAKRTLSTIREDMKAKGIDIATLEVKEAKLKAEIEEQMKVVSELSEKYSAKIEAAKEEKIVLTGKETDYTKLISDIAQENKSFFIKKTLKAPKGTADVGGYVTSQNVAETVGKFKAVEFPELVRIAKELTGSVPFLKNYPRALGMFYATESGAIGLSPKLFESLDLTLKAKVIAHEIGHLSDFLPEGTLKRGNLLGRLGSLKGYLKGKFGNLENKEIRDELIKLSEAWKPYDKDMATKNFIRYRQSAKELYADAISVLFNDPVMLKEKAPTFWDSFFELLDKKPEAKKAYFDTWELLNAGEEEVFKARRESIRKGYEKAEDVQRALFVDKMKQKTNLLYSLQILFDDVNTPINRKVKEAIKSGARIEDRTNPEFAQAGLNYMNGKIKNFVYDNFQPAFKEASKVYDGWDTLSEILQMERVIYERGELANPEGFDKLTAQNYLDNLKRTLSPADWDTLQEAKRLFREGVQTAVKEFEKNEFYNKELTDQMKANPAYATFQAVDYVYQKITSKIHEQKGTLKSVKNVGTATVEKIITTMRAIEYNNAKKASISFHKEQFKDEIQPAKSVHDGKQRHFLPSKDAEQDLVLVMEKGKLEGYYMPKDVAYVLNHTTDKNLMLAAKISRMITGTPFYRPLFTSINLGFQTFNAKRDLMRLWRSFPHETLGGILLSPLTDTYRVARGYVKAVKPSVRRALNRQDPLIKEMENSEILDLTYNDFIAGVDSDSKQIERVLQKAGVLQKTKKRNILTPIVTVLDGVEIISDFIETLPKVAGYIELRGSMPKEELAHFIRTKAGSPAFKVGGTLTPITNNILMFSNAMKEGWKTDFKTATESKTRGAWWWKTILTTILPKLLMVGASLGAFGEYLKRRMEDTSEYDKTNYNIIPLGVDENGKTINLRLPQDEWGRFIGGLTWKLSHFATPNDQDFVRDLFDLIDYGGGQLPNVTPGWVGIGKVMEFLSGRNPYDSFRGRNIIPDDEFKAGFKYSFPIFMDWLMKNQGLGIVVPSYTPKGEVSELEKVLNAPVLSNIVGRWIKVTNYGQAEINRRIIENIGKEEAETRIEERRKIDEAIKEYQSGTQNMTRRIEVEKKLVRDVVGEVKTSDDRTKANATIKKFKVGLLKGKSDPNINAVISATSNNQKIELLKQIRTSMGDNQEYKDLVNLLLKEKVISENVVKELKRSKNE